jgi:4-carboxymuconolactone decarboxylase
MSISRVGTILEQGVSGRAPMPPLPDIAQAFTNMVIDWVRGSVMARPELGLKGRELALVAACTALGCAVPQAVAHAQAALAAGATREEVIETVLHTTSYVDRGAIRDVLIALKGALPQQRRA